MIPIIMPICYTCVLYQGAQPEITGVDAPTCAAYPDGIPDAILTDGYDHRKPYRGDNGIRYSVAPGQEAALADWDRRSRLR